ncbi:hypothetical protein N7539_009181 [Penicillium diatomitis]|uniref:Uncharacterized protein n=1 Tax=Penicillium diatomitis TaxID=2819901 RepID=A0A9W9WLY4_9EURO|nr:uncharacterized protein N7539_009181 [Penicillium diatomitis]KAJ5469563.1 hypothetical protein N7539_009181 [Penicillium diatomitis]
MIMPREYAHAAALRNGRSPCTLDPVRSPPFGSSTVRKQDNIQQDAELDPAQRPNDYRILMEMNKPGLFDEVETIRERL